MKRYNRGLLIYHDHAGQNEKSITIAKMMKYLLPVINELTIRKAEEKSDLTTIIREKASEVDVLLIMGGDGTLNEALQALAELENRPDVSLLPEGTSNDFARTLHIPVDAEGAAQLLSSGKPKAVDIGRVNDRYFANFAGFGLVTEVSENIDPQLKAYIGPVSYMISALKTIQESARLFRYQWKSSRETAPQKGEAVMMMLLNGRSIGTTEIPFANESPDQGSMKLIIIKDTGIQLFQDLIEQRWKGESMITGEAVHIEPITECEIETETPMNVDTDGETVAQTPVRFTMFPGHIRFIVPEEDPS
ncbi:diacylglycerol/lipid kinase family protein [Salisediminibacterium selenitireducens]|uniref:Diacylglycerol kinase catalytic region n=1 Tax=Bacillus selenitireducens (strain ATCC 700615 / DSM 15326 / MLS10) TaxID=439292 RepID=D6XUP1_BACIE|nr:diacylglycerol kinase family protein [Salisediminibacterium selenitireducens]ADH99527.1 diacylglycerol kinase catalytic region [[Bacillus] selenitireducens MLS10]